MAAEISLSRLIRDLPELQNMLYENRRMILIPSAVVVGYFVFRDPLRDLIDRFESFVYNYYLLEGINLALRQYRLTMKVELESQKAQDPQPHNDDTLRILEIGMGPGDSLEFYPKSSRIIGLEPNPYFVDQLLEKQKRYPNLVKVVRGYAEDLHDVSDESMDAVVSTLVLCSVKDLDKSLEEVKRVLVKGGRFYFFEHQACQVSWKRYLAQILFNPFWSTFFDGCELCRQIHRHITAAGFDMSNTSQEVGHMWWICRSTTHGFAVKT